MQPIRADAAQPGDLLCRPQFTQALYGSFYTVDRVVGTLRLCADVLDPCKLQNRTRGAACKHACSFLGRHQQYLAAAKPADHLVRNGRSALGNLNRLTGPCLLHAAAAFEKKFPQVQELPDDVIRAIRRGESPVTAYQDYLLRENENRFRAMEQNTRNRTGSPGSAQSIGSANEDPFLSGFLSE